MTKANTAALRAKTKTEREVKEAAETVSPVFDLLARLGVIARGVIYGTIGVLAFQLAFGGGGKATNQTSAIETLGASPFGKLLLILMAIGLVGYILWDLIRATLNSLHVPNNVKGLIRRFGYVFSAVAYGSFLIPTVNYLRGSGSTQQSGNPPDVSAQLFAKPFGPWLVLALGVFWIFVGAAQIYTGLKTDFEKDLRLNVMTRLEKDWAETIGRYGHVARGIVFGLIGVFLIQAALTFDPNKAQGFDGSLLKLAQSPFGPFVLGIVALGLVAFGLYSALNARWAKVL